MCNVSLRTHHDVLRVEVEPGHVPVERVEVRHPLGHVDRELQRAMRVHDEAAAILLVKYLKQGKSIAMYQLKVSYLNN